MVLRIIAGLLFAAFLALQYRLWLSPNGMRDLWRTEQAIETQVEENGRLVPVAGVRHVGDERHCVAAYALLEPLRAGRGGFLGGSSSGRD